MNGNQLNHAALAHYLRKLRERIRHHAPNMEGLVEKLIWIGLQLGAWPDSARSYNGRPTNIIRIWLWSRRWSLTYVHDDPATGAPEHIAIPEEHDRGRVRATLLATATEDEVEAALKRLKPVVMTVKAA